MGPGGRERERRRYRCRESRGSAREAGPERRSQRRPLPVVGAGCRASAGPRVVRTPRSARSVPLPARAAPAGAACSEPRSLTAQFPLLPRTKSALFCLTGCELLASTCSLFFPFSNWHEPFVTVFKLGPQVPSTGEKEACIYCVELDFSVCMIT